MNRLYHDELVADLMQTYHVAWCDFEQGRYSPSFIAALTVQLPPNARVRTVQDKDNVWSLEHVLLANLVNQLAELTHALCAKKGAKRPKRIGPSYMTNKTDNSKKINTKTMSVKELNAKFAWFERMAKIGKTQPVKEVSDGKY